MLYLRLALKHSTCATKMSMTIGYAQNACMKNSDTGHVPAPILKIDTRQNRHVAIHSRFSSVGVFPPSEFLLLDRLSLLTSRRGGANSPPGDWGPVSDEVTELLLAAREWTDNRPRQCPLELSGLSLVSLLSPGVRGRLASRGLYFAAS